MKVYSSGISCNDVKNAGAGSISFIQRCILRHFAILVVVHVARSPAVPCFKKNESFSIS